MKRLLLLIFFSGSLDSFSQVVDTTQPLSITNWTTDSSVKLYRNPDGSFGFRYPENTPDTLRAICLVTLFQNGIAHSRMGWVVIEPGKRPVYLDCNKRALKLPMVGVNKKLK